MKSIRPNPSFCILSISHPTNEPNNKQTALFHKVIPLIQPSHKEKYS